VIHLLNGSTEIRQRNSDGCTVLDCGCAHTPTHWLQMCDDCYQPDAALHAQAAADHRQQQLEKELTT
jgi:hypothetical protein